MTCQAGLNLEILQDFTARSEIWTGNVSYFGKNTNLKGIVYIILYTRYLRDFNKENPSISVQ